MTTLLNVPITVAQDASGAPTCITWEGRARQVTVHLSWTVDDGWWDERIYRAYYKLTTDDRQLLVVYQDRTTGTWVLHRVYD
jgi:hypothetical protein